jgi:hypothetical protein
MPVIKNKPEVLKPETRIDQVISNLYYIIDCLTAYQDICDSGCCNDCNISRTCEYKPELGKLVRYNCPFYKKKEATSN